MVANSDENAKCEICGGLFSIRTGLHLGHEKKFCPSLFGQRSASDNPTPPQPVLSARMREAPEPAASSGAAEDEPAQPESMPPSNVTEDEPAQPAEMEPVPQPPAANPTLQLQSETDMTESAISRPAPAMSSAGSAATAPRFDLVDSEAIVALAEYMGKAEQSGESAKWRGMSARDQINHVLRHLFAFQAGNGEQHLEQALCRLMMAVGDQRRGKGTGG